MRQNPPKREREKKRREEGKGRETVSLSLREPP